METVAARIAMPWSRFRGDIDGRTLATWALAGGLVLYLALDGGGYDIVVSSQAGVVVWWMVLVGAAWGVLPAGRLSRTAWTALALFGGFVAWTALASTWSVSSEDSLQELSRVATYLAVLLLALAIHRDRETAVRNTLQAVAAAVILVAGLALVSRLRPGLFPAAQQTGQFLPGEQGRLGWPLNYWNALAALIALGLPLVLAIATSARTLRAQAAAAAALPMMALCGYLTFSRGGAIEATAALLVFMALAPDRIPKLATLMVAAAGSAALIAGAVHRSAVERGLTNAAAHHQGASLLIATVLVCAGVALAQAGIGLAARHAIPPRLLQVSRERARWIAIGAAVVIVVAALALGAPSHLSHEWQNFKRPNATAVHHNNLARFGTASGEGRYQYWVAALHATRGHILGGSGPGTFQLLWLPRAPFQSYVVNAHSLYVETLAEVGVVGLALLVGFFVLVIGSAFRLATRTSYEGRVRAAAMAAACVAFSVAAAFDWIWQVPVLPVAFLLLAASLLTPTKRASSSPPRRVAAVAVRAGIVVVAIACIVAIGVPLAATSAVRKSQAAASAGNTSAALADARDAIRLEPGAASPEIQTALVLELQHDLTGAAAAARQATLDEPANWQTWLVYSRLEAEAGQPSASVAAYRRARSLNPRSPLFNQ
jgi:hypothetical protein